MKYKRLTALLMATVLAAGLLTACGGETADTATSATTATPTTVTTFPTQQHTLMVVTADVLNVRTGPGTEYDAQGTLKLGDEVQVLAVEGDWCRIQYKGTEAYVHKDYVGLPGATTIPTTTTTKLEVTTTTKKATTTAQSPKYDDRYIDADGLLQFETDGHYVQADSYPDGEIPWALRLVNDWNPMPKGYDEALTMVKASPSVTSQPVDVRMKEALEAMLAAGKAYNIGVQSAYRSASKQSDLYWRKVNEYKGRYSDPVQVQTKAGEVVKRPGYSEHNLGLAVDLYGSGDHSLTSSFANTGAYKWLMEHCADYGFILRFPKGKESITGVIYEAWHFRYVGDAATAHAIMDNGLCLEEYLEQQKK